VHALHVRERRVVAVGKLARVAGIAAGPLLRVFGKHPTLGSGEMAEDVAESVLARLVRPLDLVARNARGDAHGAFANAVEVIGEVFHHSDFTTESFSFKRITIIAPAIGNPISVRGS